MRVHACACVDSMCVCLCKYINECVSTHARMHACTHARMHACTHARMYSCTHARIARMQACTHARMHARMHACTHARMHACTHARMHACTRAHVRTHARIHTCTHPLPVCVCTVCAYTCVTIFNYAEVLVFFAEDWCNLRCAEVHASQTLQILFTTVKKTIVKARALYKPGAHINLGTTATLSMRQRPTSSASVLYRTSSIFKVGFYSILESSVTCCAI